MKSLLIATTTLGFAAFLSACSETTNTGGSQSNVRLAPGSPPFVTTFSSSVSQASIDACRNKLDSQTDGTVQVVGTEFSQANNAVYMLVGSQRAPWRCLVSNDGRNPQVMFMGDEGSL